MNEAVILYRGRDGRVRALLNVDGAIRVWPNADVAIAEFDKVPLPDGTPWQLVELDEL